MVENQFERCRPMKYCNQPPTNTNFLILVLLLIFAVEVHATDNGITSGQWRTLSPEGEVSTWQSGSRATAGFTNHTIEMNLTPKHSINHSRHYLVVSPTYLDRVEAIFYDDTGVIKHSIFGDKVSYSNDVEQISGLYKVYIPKQTTVVTLLINTTSNLSLAPSIIDEKKLAQLMAQGSFAHGALMTILILSALLGLVSFLATGSNVALTFTMYQLAWSFLITGIHGALPLEAFNFKNTTYDWVVSYGAILALITGAICHAFVFKEVLNSRLGFNLFRGISALGTLFLLTLSLGFEQQTLKGNALLLTLAPPIIMCLLVFQKSPKNRLPVKIIYFLMMISVMVTGLSGIGFGHQFNVTYTHSLMTTLLLSIVIVSELIEKRKIAAQTEFSLQLSNTQNALTSQSLEESRAMLAMLTHEIKTPLTTLRFISENQQDKFQMNRQLDAISHVIDQSLQASDINDAVMVKKMVHVEYEILKSWSTCTTIDHSLSLDIRCAKETMVYIDPASFKIILDNLLSNAIKYSTANSTIRVYTITKGTQQRLVFSNTSPNLKSVDSKQVFTKYWRAPDAKRHRGTGLGLWIVKHLCNKQSIDIETRIRDSQFKVMLTFQNPHI